MNMVLFSMSDVLTVVWEVLDEAVLSAAEVRARNSPAPSPPPVDVALSPAPSPLPTPAPSPLPTADVALTLGMSGITCAEYTTAEEAVVNAALADHIDGADADDFSDHVCTSSGARRGLLSSGVSIATTASVSTAAYGGAATSSSDIATSIASTVSTAVSSGSFTSSVASYAVAAGLDALSSASVTSASAVEATGAPTPAPTPAPTVTAMFTEAEVSGATAAPLSLALAAFAGSLTAALLVLV